MYMWKQAFFFNNKIMDLREGKKVVMVRWGEEMEGRQY